MVEVVKIFFILISKDYKGHVLGIPFANSDVKSIEDLVNLVGGISDTRVFNTS